MDSHPWAIDPLNTIHPQKNENATSSDFRVFVVRLQPIPPDCPTVSQPVSALNDYRFDHGRPFYLLLLLV